MVPVSALRPEHSSDQATARSAQRLIELRRLNAHRCLGLELLGASEPKQAGCIEAALKEVARWEQRGLCSADYIQRWRKWLAWPVPRLVRAMCSDAAGWGNAMRQNSPFSALHGFWPDK